MSRADAASLPQPPRIARLPPALAALLAHLPGLLIAALLLAGAPPLPPLVLALLVGVIAAGLAVYWRLPPWWRAINLAFVPLLWLGLAADLDPRWYLAGFALLALTSLGAVRTRVPLYLSSARAAEELARRLPADGHLLDLGCGLGGPLARVARLRPDARLEGVEAAPLNWLFARLRLLGRAEVHLGSLWNTDLSRCDLLYAYLSPAPMARLWEKARAEMKPGSLFVSNSFTVPGVSFDEVVELDDLSGARLFIRRMG
jgi:SAM-dependent methyltransferase